MCIRDSIGTPSADQRLALAVVAAAAGAGELVGPALGVLELPTAVLDPMVDAGVVAEAERGLAVVDPLLAVAAASVLAPGDRRRVHAALAGACDADPVRQVVHLEGASAGPSDALGAQLWAVAERVRGTVGVGAAAPVFRRSAWATPPGSERAHRLLRAGEAFSSAGDRATALRCWRAAGEQAVDEPTRVEAELLGLRASVWAPGLVAVIERARTLGDRCAGAAPAAATHAYVSGLVAAIAVGELDELARFVADIDVLRSSSPSRPGAPIDALMDRAQVILGARRRVEADVSRVAHQQLAELTDGPLPDPDVIDAVCNLPQALIWCERHDEADAIAHALADRLRVDATVRPLAYLYAGLCELHSWRGDLERAVAMGDLALDHARQSDRPALATYTAAVLARALAWRGAEAAVDELLAECAPTVDAMGLMPARLYLAAAAGALAMTLERHRDAVSVLAGAAELSDRIGLVEVTVVPFEPDYIEALARCGDTGAARERLARWEERVGAVGSRWGAGSVTRLRGMLDGDADALARAADELAAYPLDRARALLGRGEVLRGRGERDAARPPLLDAVASFDASAAAPWAQRARRELTAAGFAEREPDLDRWPTLTNQERQVALAVVGGRSNREVAELLFVSTKTVEYHLTRVFRKLDVRSRVQLVRQYGHHAPEGGAVGPVRER